MASVMSNEGVGQGIGPDLGTIIGTHCDHRNCSAPVRVNVVLTSGNLGFCMHHWVSIEEAVVSQGGFVRAESTDRELEPAL